MKVLVVSQYFWPEQFLINDLVVSLKNEGIDVEVLTAEPNYPSGKLYGEYVKDKSAFNDYSGVKIHRCKIIPRRQGKLWLIANYVSFMISSSFMLLTKLKNNKFDLILFFQLSPVFSGLPAILYKKKYNVPLITWVQDLWPESLSATGQVKNELTLTLIRKFVTYLYDSSDLIYIQSESFRRKIELDCSQPKTIKYLPNWADKAFESHDVEDADFYQRKDGYFDFLFAGNLGEAQDLTNIVAAVSLIPEYYKFRVIVLGDGSSRIKFEQLVSESNLDDKFVFLGRRAICYMPSAFSKADALLVTLRNEPIFELTIPSKLQSYMASGKPIIGALSGAGAAVLKGAKAGLVASPGNPSELAEIMQEIVNYDSGVLSKMSSNARSYYNKEFRFSSIQKRLVEDMRDLL